MTQAVAAGRLADTSCQHSALISESNSDRDDGVPVVLRLDLASADAGEIPVASPTPLQHSDTYALRRREVAPHPIHLFSLVCVQFVPFQDGSSASSIAVSEALCVCLFRPFHYERSVPAD